MMLLMYRKFELLIFFCGNQNKQGECVTLIRLVAFSGIISVL